MSKSREQLNTFLKEVDIQDDIVLDVGVQDKPTRLLTKGKAKEYWTLDIDEQWKPDIVTDLNKSWAGFVVDLPNGIIEKETMFDRVFCIEVLEHCWNPIQALQNMRGLMKEGAMIHISTPFINPHHDVVDYARYTNQWYEEVLPRCGFEDIKIKERVATTGRDLLEEFFKVEYMKISKIRPEYGRYTYPVGYYVTARRAYATP